MKLKVSGLIILLEVLTLRTFAQQSSVKPSLSNESYRNWALLRSPKISNNGRYAVYEGGAQSVLCRTDGTLKKELPDARGAVFTADSKRMIYNSPNGLAILELGSLKAEYIKDAEEFSVPVNGDGSWLIYSSKGNRILRNLYTGKEKTFVHSTTAQFNDEGTVVALQQADSVLKFDLGKEQGLVIARGTTAAEFIFDRTGAKLCFLARESKGNILHYYEPGLDSAKIFISDNNRPKLGIAEETPAFSTDGQRIFLRLQELPVKREADSNVITAKVDVWHYKDQFLQSEQLEDPSLKNRLLLATVAIKDGKLTRLETADSIIVYPPKNNYGIVSNIVNDHEAYWNKNYIKRYDLVSTADGWRKTLVADSSCLMAPPVLSPGETFVIWFNTTEKHWFSYEIATGMIRNITKPITVPLNNTDGHSVINYNLSFGFAGWTTGDNAVLIYDKYDIWQVDPFGNKRPMNLTAGYGRANGIRFRLPTPRGEQLLFEYGQELFLVALNDRTKYNGFYKTRLGRQVMPKLIRMNPCLYFYPSIGSSQAPIKAKNAGVFLITRQTAAEAPDLFATKDFLSLTQLSNIQPQQKYNWLTAELVNWKMPDGNPDQGILYKPENFDPAKKYPVIFTYYEYFSQETFLYKKPNSPGVGIDIPWYVSNGYLVFVPDIKYTAGHTGKSVLNSVVSAAKHLAAFPWVDITKFGLQGHSFGGYETNYLVTHSNMFACAQEGAGMSDLLSWCGGLGFDGKHLLWFAETHQTNLRTTPWERPDIFIENSPVFSVDKVTTPLLMMHNKPDDAVPFAQAIEMFTALRRLQKPVWLLQYDGQDHTMYGKAAEDFNIRRQQFFAHYLKGAPAPVWMTEGIAAEDKGIKSGLKLDTSGKNP